MTEEVLRHCRRQEPGHSDRQQDQEHDCRQKPVLSRLDPFQGLGPAASGLGQMLDADGVRGDDRDLHRVQDRVHQDKKTQDKKA